ncbi:MAG TPA: M56 family metallopeptidase [Vicinamibacterales bacterium]|jgi:uncharacterized protein (TIGR03435 family)
MTTATVGPLADHLWQSTIVLLLCALLTLALRRNRAQVRYGLWLAASMKFLIPFAALVAIGRLVPWPRTPSQADALTSFVQAVGVPFSTDTMSTTTAITAASHDTHSLTEYTLPVLVALWALGSTTLVVVWIRRWRHVASIVRHASRLTHGRVVDALARLQENALTRGLKPALYGMRIVVSDMEMEPGVFGLRAPVLVWPRGIDDRLTDAQIEAILAHELAHIRRRDNLTSAMHMAVQAIFWFHPLMWWVGARLVDERERACDEAVVRAGSEPHVYAESILKTCQFFVESPLTCVAGVTGSNLNKRIEQIMRNQSHAALNVTKRLLLSAALVAAVAIPVAVGILTSPRVAAQVVAPAADAPTFEVTSVKPNNNRGGRMGGFSGPGRFTATGLSARRLIRLAYGIHDSQIVGGPDWLESQGYDVDATMAGDQSPERRRLMMQTLLRDRFKLAFHTERREMPIYALIAARSDGRLGEGLQRTPDGACLPRGAALAGAAPSTPGPPPPQPSPFDPDAKANCGSIVFGPGRLIAHGVPIDMLAQALGSLPAITAFNRIVENQTALEGTYDFDFKFANEFAGRGAPFPAPVPPGAAPTPGEEPALFTAMQEQLGLKLESRRSNVEVLVIDSVQKPDEN